MAVPNEPKPSGPKSDGTAGAGRNWNSAADVHQRIDQLDALATFLHADIERHKSTVARELHDDIGGSVIAAMMDVSWIEIHQPSLTPDTLLRLARIKDGLRGAIDLARKIVEELRPTLLDTIGLFAALSWQFKRACKRAGIAYSEIYPESIPQLNTQALITLFRIAQEAFTFLLQHQGITALSVAVDTTKSSFILKLADDGEAAPGENNGGIASSISHRIRQFGGELRITAGPGGKGAMVRVALPLSHVSVSASG